MIPLRDIAAWRSHAPWPDDMKVEQDLLLSRSVEAIFADKFLGAQLAMRGGTVLHKVHLAPAARYSEDIDLVLIGDRPKEHIELALKRVLEPVLGQPRSSMWADIVLAVRNLTMKSKILRMEWIYRPTISPQAEAKVKVEVNCNEKAPFYKIVQLACPTTGGVAGNIMLNSYDIDEMLGTKMRALFQREQGRDLFDLWWAWAQSEAGQSAHTVQPDRVVSAFEDYIKREGTFVGRAEYTKELDAKMTLGKFLHDMDGMLRPDIREYDVQAARDVVQSVFIDRLPDRSST